jgi:hypothetical protein
MIFQPHGSKDLHNLAPIGIDKNTESEIFENHTYVNRIIMHDQEPLSLAYLDTYRNSILNQKKSLITINQDQKEKLEIISNYPLELSNLELFKRASKSGHEGTLILCHSELYSEDIKLIEQSGIIGCYYWWHGMVARDWFRHWQYYQDLQPIDKSNCKYRFLLYSRDCTGTREYRKDLVDHCQQYQNQILYNWDGEHVDSTYSAKISISDAVNSALHIVAETLFDTGKIYLTEKVFKPMVMSQSFILFGPPGSLQYLRDYGFQTFDQCWDESYDQEYDATKRMKLLLDLIDHLVDMPDTEFQHMYEKSLPIIEHNRQRFFSQEFQDDLILEMRTNLERALLEQNQRHQHSLDDKSSTDSDDV